MCMCRCIIIGVGVIMDNIVRSRGLETTAYTEYFAFSILVTSITAHVYGNIRSLKSATTKVLGGFVL